MEKENQLDVRMSFEQNLDLMAVDAVTEVTFDGQKTRFTNPLTFKNMIDILEEHGWDVR